MSRNLNDHQVRTCGFKRWVVLRGFIWYPEWNRCKPERGKDIVCCYLARIYRKRTSRRDICKVAERVLKLLLRLWMNCSTMGWKYANIVSVPKTNETRVINNHTFRYPSPLLLPQHECRSCITLVLIRMNLCRTTSLRSSFFNRIVPLSNRLFFFQLYYKKNLNWRT